MTPKIAMRLLRETIVEWWVDDAPHLGAALAFYAVLSLAPLVVVVVIGFGYLVGPDVAQSHFVAELRGLIGREGAAAFQSMMQAAANRPQTTVSGTILGIITLIIGATGVLGELQNALNRMWDVPIATPPPATAKLARAWWQAVREVLRDRLFSLGLIMVFGFLMLISLVISAVLSASGEYLQGQIPGYAMVLNFLHLLVSFIVVTVMFGVIFKVLPDAHVAWRDVWVGAMLTSLLFTLGKFVIGLYVGQSTVASVYGAAGSVVVLLLWVYYSSQILFFGAEFTRVYARHHILPDDTPKIDGKIIDPPAN